jgi:ornithine cyclodeaminase
MKQLQSENELRAIYSLAEESVYLHETECEPSVESNNQSSDLITDITSDQISMNFESPARGCLIIKGYHKLDENNFVIKLMTEFYSLNDDLIKRKLTLVGDAQTGVITAMLSESFEKSENSESFDNIKNSSIKISNNNKINHKERVPELNWQAIEKCLQTTGHEAVCQLQKEGFKAFSAGQVTIPEVIYMPFKDYGDLHLKGAHKKGGDIYVFKIATGFPNNSQYGLLPSQGMMVAFDARTGAPLVVLKDQGHLTDLRTAIAGRNAAQVLMPANDLTGIGVLGTGVQARLQIEQLQSLYPDCKKLTVWGRTQVKAIAYSKEMTKSGWQVTVVDSPKEVADHANLIITTTPSEQALLDANDITAANTVIIAVGADMPGKVELSAALLKKADCVLIDSIHQGKDHGNAAGAINDGIICESDLQEFGDYLENGFSQDQSKTGESTGPESELELKRESKNKLKIFLSSGIGVQDLQIVQAVIESQN